jgi:hypothetical protein
MTQRAQRVIWGLGGAVALTAALAVCFHWRIDHNPVLRQWQRRTTKLVIVDYELRLLEPEKAVLAQLTTREDIDELLDLVRVKPESRWSSFVCSCAGDPHLELHDSTGHFVTIAIKHGKAISCPLGKGNLWLEDQSVPKIADYFARLGMEVHTLRRNEGRDSGVERPSDASGDNPSLTSE